MSTINIWLFRHAVNTWRNEEGINSVNKTVSMIRIRLRYTPGHQNVQSQKIFPQSPSMVANQKNL